MLILQVISEFCKNNVLTLRRVELKEACDKRLYEKTEGRRLEFGGFFQIHLNDLEGEGILKQLPNKKKKQTMIHINREKTEYFFIDLELSKSADKTELTTEVSFDSKWEKIIEEVYISGIDKEIKSRFESDTLNNGTANKSHSLLKEVAAKAMANMMSRIFEFNISYPDR